MEHMFRMLYFHVFIFSRFIHTEVRQPYKRFIWPSHTFILQIAIYCVSRKHEDFCILQNWVSIKICLFYSNCNGWRMFTEQRIKLRITKNGIKLNVKKTFGNTSKTIKAVTFHNISINYIPVRAHKNSNTFIFSISQEM